MRHAACLLSVFTGLLALGSVPVAALDMQDEYAEYYTNGAIQFRDGTPPLEWKYACFGSHFGDIILSVKGTEVFREETGCVTAFETTDLNGDGIADIAYSSSGGGTGVYTKNRTLLFIDGSTLISRIDYIQEGYNVQYGAYEGNAVLSQAMESDPIHWERSIVTFNDPDKDGIMKNITIRHYEKMCLDECAEHEEQEIPQNIIEPLKKFIKKTTHLNLGQETLTRTEKWSWKTDQKAYILDDQ